MKSTQRQQRQWQTASRLVCGLSVAAMLCGAAMAQQPAAQQTAPPPIMGVLGANDMPKPAAKPATTSSVSAKTVAEMVNGGQAAVSGVGEQKGKLGDEGLKMHGHWVIDVKNPDGTLASHNAFENSIQLGGQAYLIGLMAGYVVPADYEIFLQAAGTGASPCVMNSNQGCAIVRSATTSPGNISCTNYVCATTLTYATNQNYSSSANSFVLSGSITANQTGTIGFVSTYAGSCPSTPIQTGLATTTPAACPAASATNNGFNALTGTALATPINVTSGQFVQVTVTITFS